MHPLFFTRVLPMTVWIPTDGRQYMAALLAMMAYPETNEGIALAVIDPDDEMDWPQDSAIDPPPLGPPGI